jgi:hypothetical protein
MKGCQLTAGEAGDSLLYLALEQKKLWMFATLTLSPPLPPLPPLLLLVPLLPPLALALALALASIVTGSNFLLSPALVGPAAAEEEDEEDAFDDEAAGVTAVLLLLLLELEPELLMTII